jgi:hypothetical protein
VRENRTYVGNRVKGNLRFFGGGGGWWWSWLAGSGSVEEGSARFLVDISSLRIRPRLKGRQSCLKRSQPSSVTRSFASPKA